MSSLIDSLTEKRVFNIFVPDITREEAQENRPYVLRIVIPRGAQFLEVLQLSSGQPGVGRPVGVARTAYAFLSNPEEEERRHFYVTAVFSERDIPWHASNKRPESFVYYPMPAIRCVVLGITSHNGLPILHVSTEVGTENYDPFEEELRAYGYQIVHAKPYEQATSLLEMMKAYAQKA